MVLWILGSVIVITLTISYGSYWIAFYNPVKRHQETIVIRSNKDSACLDQLCREMSEQPFEQVTITSADGLKLYGRYYHRSDTGPVHILFHGYRGSGIRDFCAIDRVCSHMNVNTLVVDQRAHGNSEGKTMTFGILERHDCLRWAEYAAARFGNDRKIFLSGVSMGAATVLMAASLPLPENVSGIIADCPYSAPGAIIRKVISDMHAPAALIYPFVVLGAFIFGGFSLWEESPLHAVSNTRIPILLIHGIEDKFVPSQMSNYIYERCGGERYIELFPGAGHGGCCATDPKRYEKILRSFTGNCE